MGRALEIMRVDETVHLVVQDEIAPVSPVGGDFHGHVEAGRAAARELHVKFHAVPIQTVMGIHNIAPRADGRNHQAILEGELPRAADGQGLEGMGVFFLIKKLLVIVFVLL